jgi:hypothetical protein
MKMANQLLNKLLNTEIEHQIVIKVNREKRNKNGEKTRYCKGIILSWKMTAENGKSYVFCGHSLCDNKDRFNREIAYKLAIARAIKRFNNSTYEFPNSISPEFNAMISRMELYYKDVVFPTWHPSNAKRYGVDEEQSNVTIATK